MGAAVPILGVAGITLDFVQDGMNPGGSFILEILDDLVRGIPLALQSQIDGLIQLG